MTFVVVDNCIKCKYTDCVEVCPVDCFYRTFWLFTRTSASTAPCANQNARRKRSSLKTRCRKTSKSLLS